MKNNDKTNFGVFSFFTGAGFLDLGFEDAGFAPCECISRRGRRGRGESEAARRNRYLP